MSSHHTSKGPESSQLLLPVDMNFMTPRVGSAARRLQHCQMTPNSYSGIRVKTTGISNILAATRQSIENLACDSIAARSRFGLVTCVIHELTVALCLPQYTSKLRTTFRLTSQSRNTENTGDRLHCSKGCAEAKDPKGE